MQVQYLFVHATTQFKYETIGICTKQRQPPKYVDPGWNWKGGSEEGKRKEIKQNQSK